MRLPLSLSEDYVLDVPVAPEALASRLRAAISVRPKRAFGVIKVHSEWVGLVGGKEFDVWERQQHATHARGRIIGRRGGSRVEARIGLTRRAGLLAVLFFALFAFVAVGFLGRPEGPGSGQASVGVAALGALAIAGLFWSYSLRQRAALRRFLNEVFREREGPTIAT